LKKKALIISVITAIVAIIFLIGVIKSAKSPASTSKAGAAGVSDNKGLILQAEQLENEGKYLEAKAIYWKAIVESSDNEVIKEAEERLYGLNMKILFSPVITDDSITYTIVKGDTLSRIAKKFDTTIELIKKSNKLQSDLIRPGKELKVSRAKYSVVVDKSQNILILKSNDKVLKVYRVSTGKDMSTPLGSFKVINKLVDPTWYTAGAIVSPDSPENILGSRWIGLSVAGYGIHGTTEPETIGKNITAGCVRMVNEDVAELYSIIPMGTEVTIMD